MKISKTITLEELLDYLRKKEYCLNKDLEILNRELIEKDLSISSRKRMMQGKQRIIGRLKEITSMRRELNG